MRLRVEPGGALAGVVRVPGDKSIAHRWLILAASAEGRSTLRRVPPALDVRSTARCMSKLSSARSLASWADAPASDEIHVEGDGWTKLRAPSEPLDCGNSGTTMRLLSGVLAAFPGETTLTGDASLSRRPMERVAEPLRRMGAEVRTTDGHAPIVIRGGDLAGIEHRTPVPTAQVKSAVLLAGLRATGETSVIEPAATRDHTERALEALGAPVRLTEGRVTVSSFQHKGFEGDIPGDPSSAAFLLAAAGITGSRVGIRDVGLNPSRTAFLDVLRRMGVHVREKERWVSLGEPAGILEIEELEELRPVVVTAQEFPLLHDEVPALAAIAAHAGGESRFEGAAELRVKESDRLAAIVAGIRGLGGVADTEADTLVIGGGGLAGGTADAAGDHRIAMALAVTALGARSDCFIDGMEWADVTFPGFGDILVELGARTEPA